MILVTGATGNVGSEVVARLKQSGAPFKVASRRPPAGNGTEAVLFDFERPETFAGALVGVTQLFLVRPPAISDVKEMTRKLMEEAKRAGVRHVVFLSLLGAEKNQVVPHRKMEDLIIASGVPYTFLRASFFMENLSTTHARDIREQGEILVPAGSGKTSFIDVRDIAAVAAEKLIDIKKGSSAIDLTGDAALSYHDVAQVMSDVLGRRIVYREPSILRFCWQMSRQGVPFMMILVMVGIYTVARLGKASRVTPDVEEILRRKPIGLRQFVEDHRAIWLA